MTASFRVSQNSSKEDLLEKIDSQKRHIANQLNKIERQRHQINILNNRVIERNNTIAAQDRVIAEQGDELHELRGALARLQQASKAD
ncbi:hypothetical protein [Streptomyces sp. CBMA152]|uniref:hypothetical protein n=1 Tax=Streptomyces sp. CBMA152 TaxID=1896312 RepID=UPI001661728B|nr:hypothetical protein [Streptomyces sp. CBMA152]MBD0743618.1 hypothetical protein [Streptomyces sp. CBMA152]